MSEIAHDTTTPAPAPAVTPDGEAAEHDLALGELVQRSLAPGTAGEPYGRYRRLRVLAPAHHVEGHGVVLSRFEDCRRVLSDRETFPVVDVEWMARHIPGWNADQVPGELFSSLFFRNPPEHTRLRTRLSCGFTTRRLEKLRSVVAGEVRTALEELRGQRTPETEPVDFQDVVSVPLALAVLGELLGVPPEDRRQCWDLLNIAVPGPAPGASPAERETLRERATAASGNLGAYLVALVEERRARPADDLISACLSDEDPRSDPWTSRELALALLPVFGSGVTTLSDTLGNAVYALLRNLEELARLAVDPALAPTAAAEIVRYCGAYHVTRRYARRQVEIGGLTVPEQSAVILLLGSADRDGDRFVDPERFDVGRPDRGSLGFGAGIHRCLGATLAKIVLEELCRALPGVEGLRLAGPPRWRPSVLFFGPESLPVSFDGGPSRLAGPLTEPEPAARRSG